MSRVRDVSALTELLKSILGTYVGEILVEGELSELTIHQQGHWYFSIKDAESTVRCVMFARHARRVGWRPEPGQRLLLTGWLDMYAPQGRVSLVVEKLRPRGAGVLLRRRQELAARLEAEGLFAPDHKRALPFLPRCIGVATSPDGAVIHDIARVLADRCPGRELLLAPCRVQGPAAAEELCEAIDQLVAQGRCELLIVARGGGSIEDLAAFDTERVARAIAAAPLPVISAVGHETDVTIADLAADVRAATPSHAAELAVPELAQLERQLDALRGRLHQGMMRRLEHSRGAFARLRLSSPQARLSAERRKVAQLGQQRDQAMQRHLARQQRELALAASRLQALSPMAVLARGYSLTLRDGMVVASAQELEPGQQLSLRLGNDWVRVRVEALPDHSLT